MRDVEDRSPFRSSRHRFCFFARIMRLTVLIRPHNGTNTGMWGVAQGPLSDSKDQARICR